jgi:hypothetical protein
LGKPIERRKEALSFMVETGLIADSDIKADVEKYLTQKKPIPAFVGVTKESLEELGREEALSSLILKAKTASSDGKSWFYLDSDNRRMLLNGIGRATLSTYFVDRIVSAEFSRDSSKILVVTQEPEVFILDAASLEKQSVFTPPWVPDSANFAEDGKKIVLKHGRGLPVWLLQRVRR